MDSAWGIKPGSWAEDVEQEEAKNGPLRDEEAFPTLGEAVKQEPKAGKTAGKKKPVKMGLTDFLGAQTARRNAINEKEILMALPKGSSGLPREDRDSKGLGGGFKDYGGNREGGFGRGDREGRPEREPSRADASGDWGAERKFTPSDTRGGSGGFGGGFSRDRAGGGGFGDRAPREDRPVSEADTADDWGANRKFTPSSGTGGGGGGGFGGGFSRDREGGERSGGFRDRPARFEEGPSRADEGDWGARRAPQPMPEREGAAGGRRGYGFSEQPVSQADVEDRWSHRPQPTGAAAENGAPGGAAERPRLKLAPRTKPLEHPPAAAEAAAAAVVAEAASPHSDAGSSSSSQRQQQQARKSNPFGAARPREEVLKEKGIDYQKEQLKLEHGEVIRDKTAEEADMEKEVEELRVRLEGLKELTPGETDTISELAGELDEKEKALYRLQAELDDKVRFSKNRPERERSADPVARSSNTSAAAAAGEGEAGFVEVRKPRKERSAAAGPAAEGAAAAAPEREGSGGAWARGGSFRDSKGEDRGGGSFSRGRGEGGRGEGGRGDGGRGDGGRGESREARGGRGGDRAPGRSGGGW